MGTIPAPNIAGDILGIQQQGDNSMAEYARAAALRQQTQQAQAMAPGQQQMQQQEIQQREMANKQQELDLQDAQNAHKLGPQFLKKDADGNITGFDS